MGKVASLRFVLRRLSFRGAKGFPTLLWFRSSFCSPPTGVHISPAPKPSASSQKLKSKPRCWIAPTNRRIYLGRCKSAVGDLNNGDESLLFIRISRGSILLPVTPLHEFTRKIEERSIPQRERFWYLKLTLFPFRAGRKLLDSILRP